MALAALLALGLTGCSDGGSLVPAWNDDTPQARRAEPAPPMAASQPVETAQMAPIDEAQMSPAASARPAAASPMPAASPAPMSTASASPPQAAASQPLSLQAQDAPQAQPAAVSDHCRKIAKDRAGDAAYSGEDEETQTSVYNRTYADCIAWDNKHAS
jgi:hypothetical protein